MASFSDFTQEREELHLMNIEYTEQFGDPIVHLFTRDQDGGAHWVEVEGHHPSFYIREDAFSSRVKNNQWVVDWERAPASDGSQSVAGDCSESPEQRHENIHGDPLVRVFVVLPEHVGGTDSKKGLREYFGQTWEADVFYCNRFLIDTEIYTHFSVDLEDTWDGNAVQGDYRVHVDDLEPISDPSWQAEPRILTIDIEVEAPDGFPEPDEAANPVTAITAHDSHEDSYDLWTLCHEEWEHSDDEIKELVRENIPEPIEVGDETVDINSISIYIFEDEGELLHDFNQHVEDKGPDLLSGWNSSTTDNGKPFDYPYLINRCKVLNTLSYRDWSPFGEVWDGYWGPVAKGVEFHDMMKAYEKTRWSKPKGGYSLKNISSNELPIGKLELDDLDDAWKNDPATFLKYNLRDVQAVVGIDVAAEVTDLFQNLRKLTGAQWGDTHNNIDLLDLYILRFAQKEGIALPTNEEPDRGWFYGGHVFEPELGRHPNAVYPDVWSEYPNAFRTCNMSPETIIGTEEDLDASEYTEEDCRWSYIDTRPTNVKYNDGNPVPPEYEKCYYLKPEIKEGFMNTVVDHVMGLKDDYDGTDLYGPVKQIVNSVWGVYGDSDSYGKGYRLFDWRVAESITLYGRKVVQYSAEKFVDSVNHLKDTYGYDGQKARLVGGDTDSVMTSIPFMGADTRADQKKIVELAEEACEIVNESYDDFAAETFNSDGTYIELEIESYAPWLFIPAGVTRDKAKKRYAEIIAWEEGTWYDPPEFSVTGIGIVRSDRAAVTRETLQSVLDNILRIDDPDDARGAVYDTISEVVESIEDGGMSNGKLARPKGMSKDPEEYGSAEKTPQPTYRGAKYANQNFGWEQLGEGSKPNLLYIDRIRGQWPRTYTAETKEDGRPVDAVAVEHPEKVPTDFQIDTDKMIEKTLEDPLEPILSPMGWSFEEALSDTEQVTLAEMM